MGYWGKIVAMGLNQSLVKIASKHFKRFGHIFPYKLGKISVSHFGNVISRLHRFEKSQFPAKCYKIAFTNKLGKTNVPNSETNRTEITSGYTTFSQNWDIPNFGEMFKKCGVNIFDIWNYLQLNIRLYQGADSGFLFSVRIQTNAVYYHIEIERKY